MSKPPTVVPFLWYDGAAEEAARHYVSIFPDARLVEVSGMSATFELQGQRLVAFNGGPTFTFNEAISLSVSCDSQQEIDHFWTRLGDGGTELQCGWLKDRYGLAWQVVPRALPEMLQDADRERAQRVMDAMMSMKKLDIAMLRAAWERE
ncbi:MAG TPA: VOC family protein [Woeseiaceae bacterium]|nr:VOC family protein [Woeseiaceae bacterium]